MDVGIKLRPATDGGDKHVDTSEFGDVVTSCNEEFGSGDAAAKVSKLVKLGQGGSNGGFGRRNFMMGARTKHGLELLNEFNQAGIKSGRRSDAWCRCFVM